MFGITTSGLNDQEKTMVLNAAGVISKAFISDTGGAAEDAFKSVYNKGISFVKSDQTCQAATGYECWGRTQNLGGIPTITIFTNANNQYVSLPQDYNNFLVHEMGHAFDISVGLRLSQGYSQRISLITSDKWTPMPLGNDGFATVGFPSLWVQGNGVDNSGAQDYAEQVANMFLGWVYGHWGTDQRRANWMKLWMPQLLNGTEPTYAQKANCNEDTGAGCS
jgi:hypothetical protein